MNLEKVPKSETRRYTHKSLGRACRQLTEMIGDQNWSDDEIRALSLTRTVTERVSGLTADSEYLEHKPVEQTVEVRFHAEKDSSEAIPMPHVPVVYTLESTVYRELRVDELPDSVKDDVLLEGEEELDEDSLLELSEGVEYCIGGDGSILDYATPVRYILDGDVVWENEYRHSRQFEEGEEYERVRAYEQPPLSAEMIEQTVEGMDDDLRRLYDGSGIDELLDEAAPQDGEHIRRILAIISLVSSGIAAKK